MNDIHVVHMYNNSASSDVHVPLSSLFRFSRQLKEHTNQGLILGAQILTHC